MTDATPIVLLMLAFMIFVIGNSKPIEHIPLKPKQNAEELTVLANYCLRYQKQPYINNCINDRAQRNLIDGGK